MTLPSSEQRYIALRRRLDQLGFQQVAWLNRTAEGDGRHFQPEPGLSADLEAVTHRVATDEFFTMNLFLSDLILSQNEFISAHSGA
jgi:hypothetical protein